MIYSRASFAHGKMLYFFERISIPPSSKSVMSHRDLATVDVEVLRKLFTTYHYRSKNKAIFGRRLSYREYGRRLAKRSRKWRERK
jgi:hypothetical protein